MSNVIKKNIGRNRCCFVKDLQESQHQLVLDLALSAPESRKGPLGSMHSIKFGEVDGIGPLVVKYYTRRGILRHFVSQTYFSFGSSRAEQELDLLLQVRALGLNAPEPVASISKGMFFYNARLVTKEVIHKRSFADLGPEDEELMPLLIGKLVDQINILVKNKIFHIDLHPDNVLFDDKLDVYIIDFDKARLFKGSARELKRRYLCRWRRAVIKHNLPDLFSELVSLGLRHN